MNSSERNRVISALRTARRLESQNALPPSLHDLLLLSEEDIAERAVADDDGLDELIIAVRGAEKRFSWVAISYLRDHLLRRGTVGERLDLINRAIEERILLVDRIPNPRNPAFPTSAARLNRSHSRVVARYPARSSGEPRFEPLRIRGEGLSTTVLEDRR